MAAGAIALGASCAREPRVEAPAIAQKEPTAGGAAESPLAAATGAPQRGLATYYAQRFAGRRTANGERYDPRQMTAAHRSLPFGTLVEVRRAPGGRAVLVRINDRGPYGAGRIIDLSRRAAEELGIVAEGKVAVELRVVAPPATAN